VKQQFDLQHNYEFSIKVAASDDSEWYVWDRRPVSGQPEEKREVQVNENSMRCSCSFPQTHLLPCRHVLVINLHLYRAAFQVRQVGQRWLKYYKPLPAATSHGQSVSEPPPPALPSAISSSLSGLVQAGKLPARNARYGQLMGYYLTICTRAAEYKDIFHTVLEEADKLAKWVEAKTSTTELATAPAKTSSPSDSSSAALTDMHPSLSIEQVTLPQHMRKLQGRHGERRQKGAAETAPAKRAKLTASQMC
jgi:hypothetical protein